MEKLNCFNVFSITFIYILLTLHIFLVSRIETHFCSPTPNELKFDCTPQGKSDSGICEQRNCCWTPANQSFTQWPWCYYPECYNNYNTINVTKTSTGIVAFFNLSAASHYKNNVELLRLEVIFETLQRIRITVSFIIF